MYALAIAPETCSDCGREWPSRFGAHNCNYHRAHVHNAAVVVDPGTPLSESVGRLTGRMESEVARSAQYADLAGEGDPYGDALGDIDHAIGQLKRFRAEMQRLAHHSHNWGADDYCTICGADGRA